MGEMGAFVLTENAARPLETFAAIMREMDSLIGTRSATGGATARFSFRTLRGQCLTHIGREGPMTKEIDMSVGCRTFYSWDRPFSEVVVRPKGLFAFTVWWAVIFVKPVLCTTDTIELTSHSRSVYGRR